MPSKGCIGDKIKKRSFAGCDTCRKRKVKCDGKRPQCTRCVKAKLDCEGYGINLKFCAPLTVENGKLKQVQGVVNSRPQRRHIPFMRFKGDMIYKTMDDLDNVMTQIEEADLNKMEDIKVGPFSLIKINLKEELKNQKGLSLPSISTIMQSKPKQPSSLIENFKFENSITDFTEYMADLRSKNRTTIPSATVETNPDVIIPRPVWIHPRLKIDAMMTYQTLIGTSDTITDDWNLVIKTVFSELYGTSDSLKSKIIDHMNVSDDVINSIIKYRSNEVLIALAIKGEHVNPVTTFTSLLRLSRVQELVRLFVKSQPSVMFLSFHGCFFDTVVIPLLYKIVGELLVFETSIGIPGDWTSVVSENLTFKQYCDILKRTYCMVALSITAFAQYTALFSENGIFDVSLCFFKCFIAFREMSLVNIAKLIKSLVKDYDAEIIKSENLDLLKRLNKAGLLKELVITLILAIYQDSNVDILHNYKILYGVLDQIKEFCKTLNEDDEQLSQIWLWYRYVNFFFKSCSTIDLENYRFDEEGFEDLKSDYNLVKNFNFNDHFKPSEFNKIEIKSMPLATDNNQTSESSDSEDEEPIHIPKRLRFRPNLPDKPPKTFSVTFNFQNDDSETSSDYDLDSDAENFNKVNVNDNINDKYRISDDPSAHADNHSNKKYINNLGIDADKLTVTKKAKVIKNKNEIEASRKVKEKVEKHEILAEKIDNKNNCSKEIKNSITSNPKTSNNLETDSHFLKSNQVDPLTGLTHNSLPMTKNDHELVYSQSKTLLKIPHPADLTNSITNVPNLIEISFGIPLSLLKLMERLVKLADHRNWSQRNQVFPRNFPKFCCDLEEELINWKLPWDLYKKKDNGELNFYSLFHKALYHLITAFYNSTLIYFLRLIKDLDPNLLQDHVISTITHLEELKKLSNLSTFHKEMKLSPPFWCFFISGSDAIGTKLQQRFDDLAKTWFVAGNKWIGKQILLDIWKQGEGSWLDMIKSWEVSGFN